mmetsp:Transcript_100730/g.215915  ORF Transcript_100730/g.215915 Transcript_100730/m.215915 type:complete len:260 (-) Transcript_100730:1424-2203(-)
MYTLGLTRTSPRPGPCYPAHRRRWWAGRRRGPDTAHSKHLRGPSPNNPWCRSCKYPLEALHTVPRARTLRTPPRGGMWSCGCSAGRQLRPCNPPHTGNRRLELPHNPPARALATGSVPPHPAAGCREEVHSTRGHVGPCSRRCRPPPLVCPHKEPCNGSSRNTPAASSCIRRRHTCMDPTQYPRSSQWSSRNPSAQSRQYSPAMCCNTSPRCPSSPGRSATGHLSRACSLLALDESPGIPWCIGALRHPTPSTATHRCC